MCMLVGSSGSGRVKLCAVMMCGEAGLCVCMRECECV